MRGWERLGSSRNSMKFYGRRLDDILKGRELIWQATNLARRSYLILWTFEN